MSSIKQLKLMEKAAAQQKQVISELNALAKTIERCEKTITDLKSELEAVNTKHQNRKTTQEDIDYLTELLRCAHKKLSWEKQIASLQKRTPVVLESMARLMNDPQNPPDEQTRGQMVQSLQTVQTIMERLQNVKF